MFVPGLHNHRLLLTAHTLQGSGNCAAATSVRRRSRSATCYPPGGSPPRAVVPDNHRRRCNHRWAAHYMASVAMGANLSEKFFLPLRSLRHRRISIGYTTDGFCVSGEVTPEAEGRRQKAEGRRVKEEGRSGKWKYDETITGRTPLRRGGPRLASGQAAGATANRRNITKQSRHHPRAGPRWCGAGPVWRRGRASVRRQT
jgi:hypothetical protein